jgi:hypothetical protein
MRHALRASDCTDGGEQFAIVVPSEVKIAADSL